MTEMGEPGIMPEHVSAVLFDLDGVLVDSMQVVERAWRRWASEQDVPAEDVLSVVHGRLTRDVIRMFAPHLEVAQEALRIGRYETGDSSHLEAVPGAHDCVAVAQRGPWAVVTSGGRDLARGRLVAVGLPIPSVMVTADDVTLGKPDPEPYQRASLELGVPARECVVVEDAPAGILAGKRAGMTVLAVTTTHPATSLCDADLVFTDLRGVTEYLRTTGR